MTELSLLSQKIGVTCTKFSWDLFGPKDRMAYFDDLMEVLEAKNIILRNDSIELWDVMLKIMLDEDIDLIAGSTHPLVILDLQENHLKFFFFAKNGTVRWLVSKEIKFPDHS